MPKVAVIIVTWNGQADLDRLLPSLTAVAYPPVDLVYYFVDNASRDQTLEKINSWKKDQPFKVIIIANKNNLGFAAGNNLAITAAVEAGYDYISLLNQDTAVTSSWLNILIEQLEANQRIGSVQPLILLGDGRHINSWGNNINFLGFGYAGGNHQSLAAYRPVAKTVAYCSGAAVVYRVSALRAAYQVTGDWLADWLYMYHEDLELGWRLSLLGWQNRVVPTSRITHYYRFNSADRLKARSKFFYMERNRYLALLEMYDVRTLVFIFLPLLVMEIGQWPWALLNGWLLKRLAIWPAITRFVFAKWFWQRRARIQANRLVKERTATAVFSGIISYQEINNWLLDYIVNPLFKLWWSLVRFIMFW